MSDFLRYCELVVGPLADWQNNGGNRNQAIKIVADGSNKNLRIGFNANKTITGEPNKIDILVYNLSNQTRQAIRSNLTKIELIAGYESSRDSVGLVASGAIMSVVSRRQGSDIITNITAYDGYGGMVRGAYSRAFASGTSLAQAVRDVAGTIAGVTVGKINVTGNLPAKGIALSGSSTAQLNKLADQFGFSWSVQDGIFQAISDKSDSGNGFSFSSQSNLITCVPLLNGPLQVQVGVEIAAKFDARMKPGDRMIVQSDVAPQLSGTYKATSVGLAFDSHGPAALTAQSMRLF